MKRINKRKHVPLSQLGRKHKKRRIANICQALHENNANSIHQVEENGERSDGPSHLNYVGPHENDSSSQNEENTEDKIYFDFLNHARIHGIYTDESEPSSVRSNSPNRSQASRSDSPGSSSESFFSNLSEESVIKENYRDKLKRDLAQVFTTQNVPFATGDKILLALRQHPALSFLPKTAKTLIGTPRNKIDDFINDIGEGKYLHLGLKKELKEILESLPANKRPKELHLDFSADGGQSKRSRKTQFWPLQYRAANLPDVKPLYAGVYIGKKKPSKPEDFFGPFVSDVLEIIENGGIELSNGTKIPVLIRCYIADAPARALALNHISHTSFHPCSKCYVVGYRCYNKKTGKNNGPVVFPNVENRKRTHEEYDWRVDDEHVRGETVLSRLPIDLVVQVPYDYMHLVLLGVLKRMLQFWFDGDCYDVKLSDRQMNILSSRCSIVRPFIPSEFGTRFTDIQEFSEFKATEYRRLLLYTGPTVFHGIITQTAYDHFLLLHSSLRVVASNDPSEELLLYAEESLKEFVQLSPHVYDESFPVYNVHGLLHLVDDTRQFGPVDSWSSFLFENNMREFSKRMRKQSQELQQYWRRLQEIQKWNKEYFKKDKREVKYYGLHDQGPVAGLDVCAQFQKYQNEDIILGRDKRDNCVMLHDNSLCLIQNIVKVSDEFYLVVQKFSKVIDFYDTGRGSIDFDVFLCSSLSENYVVSISDVKKKCLRTPLFSCAEGHETEILDDIWVVYGLLQSVEAST